MVSPQCSPHLPAVVFPPLVEYQTEWLAEWLTEWMTGRLIETFSYTAGESSDSGAASSSAALHVQMDTPVIE